MFCSFEKVKNTKCGSGQCLFYYLDDCLKNIPEQIKIVSGAFSTNLSTNLEKFLELFKLHESENNHDSIQQNGFTDDLFNLKIKKTFSCISTSQTSEYFYFIIENSSLFDPNKNLKPYFTGFFCENCQNFHQDSLKVEKIPTHIFIILNSKNNPLTLENLKTFQNLPLTLTSDYFPFLENPQNLHLSGMILSNSESNFSIHLNKNRLWDIPYLNAQDCSLFDLIHDFTQGGFYPIQLLYSKTSRGSFKISSKAWQLATSKVILTKKLRTFSCGKIREEDCLCCSSNSSLGWRCSCGKTSHFSFCKCGNFISKCPKCKNFNFSITCKECGDEEHLKSSSTSSVPTCSICGSPWESSLKICRTCLNPDPSIFLISD
jgi:hypothetical protein